MKTIGLIGGMSWESSIEYYRIIMEEDFYMGRLTQNYGLEVLVPEPDERKTINRIIYDELCLGNIVPSSKEQYLKIIGGLVNMGAEGIILGCTEIGLLVRQQDCTVPLFDTTRIHAEAAVELELAD